MQCSAWCSALHCAVQCTVQCTALHCTVQCTAQCHALHRAPLCTRSWTALCTAQCSVQLCEVHCTAVQSALQSKVVHIVIPISLWLGDNSFEQFLICDFTEVFTGKDVVWAEFCLFCFLNKSFKLRPVCAVSKPPPCWWAVLNSGKDWPGNLSEWVPLTCHELWVFVLHIMSWHRNWLLHWRDHGKSDRQQAWLQAHCTG